MNPTGSLKHITYVDIPDLDAGRIPFPMSGKGRYAVGERKTVLLLLSDSFSSWELDSTLQSLFEVLRNPVNRVFIDILVVDWDDNSRKVSLQTWEEKYKEIEDCSFYSIQPSLSMKNTHYSLIDSAFQFIIQSQYEQLFLVSVWN